jgi:hypothetical protein
VSNEDLRSEGKENEEDHKNDLSNEDGVVGRSSDLQREKTGHRYLCDVQTDDWKILSRSEH